MSCFLSLIGENQWTKCPICMKIYGVMKGNQPQGTMKISFIKDDCEGYFGEGTIKIKYNIEPSIVDSVKIEGTCRTAYLPNTAEGNEVLNLLQKCFDRKLIFTIGTSVTTGVKNQIVWNGIHHKTSMAGGSSNYGYPDPTYFTRVKEELAAKGVK
eukprot:TRINITY_DN2196_c0_g1_i1.p2 TRINITY_DN2196_c0_g1~~TRINITY_DN2196_c0_g1_i1.p2  ORF type:complete len:155 (-),score=22.69 TRINITY_DN2196_c0_g1_i1:14-478(-)